MHMLKNITISTNALLLRPNTVGYEALPLLRVLWATRATKLQVIINNDEASYSSHYCYHLDTLNTVLELTGRQDTLGLKRHAKFIRTLQSVLISKTVRSGEVHQGGTSACGDVKHILVNERAELS
jgi:hypothetical protein